MMNRLLLLSIAILLHLCGCTSSPTTSASANSPNAAGIQRKPSALEVGVGGGLGSSPGGMSSVDGVTAAQSDRRAEPLEVSYRNILASEDPSAEMSAYLIRLKKIYFRSEARLADFDKALDQTTDGFELADLPAYRGMVAMWELKHRMIDKIGFVYTKLQATTADSSASENDKMVAARVLKSFQAELKSTDAQDQVVYHDLNQHLASLAPAEGAADAAVAALDTKETADLAALVRRTRPVMQKLGAQEEKKEDDVSKELAAIKANMDVDVADASRTPQSARIEPSTGPGGTITGNTFPAGVWALTYDDGPHPVYTMKDVANLQANNVKATFFWLAQNIKTHGAIVKSVMAAGFPVENHSWSHPNLASSRDLARLHTNLTHEIVDSTAVDTQFYGEHPRFFRCPYGSGINSPAVRQLIASQGMINVFWNVDSLDWQDKNPASILARVKKQMAAQRHGIILFHDIHPQSVEGSRMMMQSVKGVEWVTIPEIVDRLNGGH